MPDSFSSSFVHSSSSVGPLNVAALKVSSSTHCSSHYAQRFLTFWLRPLKQSVENYRIFPFQNIDRHIHTKFSVRFHDPPEGLLRICCMHSSWAVFTLMVSFVSFKQMTCKSLKFILACLHNLRCIFFPFHFHFIAWL